MFLAHQLLHYFVKVMNRQWTYHLSRRLSQVEGLLALMGIQNLSRYVKKIATK